MWLVNQITQEDKKKKKPLGNSQKYTQILTFEYGVSFETDVLQKIVKQ